MTRKEDLETLDWLTRFDYGPQQSDHLKKRQPGTGKWFLQSTEYQNWRERDNNTLLCTGIPGAGKTIISAIAVDDLMARRRSNRTLGLAYIFYDSNRKKDQKAEDILASVLKQLSQCQSSLPKKVEKLYQEHKDRRTQPSINELFAGLKSVTKLYTKVFVVIDALDECEKSDGCRNVVLSQMFKLQQIRPVKILATARPIPEIIEKFRGDRLEVRAHQSDVRKFLKGSISRTGSDILKEHEEEIIDGITEVVDGM